MCLMERQRIWEKRFIRILEAYIDCNYVEEVRKEEYGDDRRNRETQRRLNSLPFFESAQKTEKTSKKSIGSEDVCEYESTMLSDFETEHESRLEERMRHMSDTFSEYLMYLIQERNMENAEVWKRAIVDRKIFSKIKNNASYHPNKLTALCLVRRRKTKHGRDQRSACQSRVCTVTCDKTDIIFSYFIENEIYDMIELDIQLEEHGLPCIHFIVSSGRRQV